MPLTETKLILMLKMQLLLLIVKFNTLVPSCSFQPYDL